MMLDIVYNPASGHFQQKRLNALADAFSARGFQPRLAMTRPDGVSVPDDARLVCVHGGDGTLQMVAQALGERAGRVPLCIYPAGTVNLIARELGYASDPESFAGQVAAAWSRGAQSWVRSPLVDFDGTPVMACLSIGPDSAVVAGLSSTLKARIGRYAYLVSGFKLLGKWPRHTIEISAGLTDGDTVRTHAEAVFLARGRFYAGPFELSPKARVDADSFELVTLPKAGRLRCAGMMLALMAGLRPDSFGLTKSWTVRSVELGNGALPVQVDGDALPPRSVRAALGGPVVSYCI
jgi:diacylglycerol kinase family enzyme